MPGIQIVHLLDAACCLYILSRRVTPSACSLRTLLSMYEESLQHSASPFVQLLICLAGSHHWYSTSISHDWYTLKPVPLLWWRRITKFGTSPQLETNVCYSTDLRLQITSHMYSCTAGSRVLINCNLDRSVKYCVRIALVDVDIDRVFQGSSCSRTTSMYWI